MLAEIAQDSSIKHVVRGEKFIRWCEQKIWFLTRIKSNATYDVVRENPIPKNSNTLKDEIIQFNGTLTSEKCDSDLRRIEVWDEENQ